MNHQLNEEPCPVSEHLLGELYRASAQGLEALIKTVPASMRGELAHYCYRRAHLTSLGLAIALRCDRKELMATGTNGDALYRCSRQPDEAAPLTQYARRRTVTLATAAMS